MLDERDVHIKHDSDIYKDKLFEVQGPSGLPSWLASSIYFPKQRSRYELSSVLTSCLHFVLFEVSRWYQAFAGDAFCHALPACEL